MFTAGTSVLKQSAHGGMDVFVLVEAIAKCVCSEEKELCRIGEVALQVVLETATTLMGSIDKVRRKYPKFYCNNSSLEQFFLLMQYYCAVTNFNKHM